MDKKTKDKLKLIPKSRCSICNMLRSYTNPVWRCYECKKKFCFDHLWGGQIKKGMGINEEVRNICDKCKEKFGYKTLGS